jgi:ATP-binding cassette subfamily B protein
MFESVLDPTFRRTLAYITPYRYRLVPVLVLSLVGTLLSLCLPYLSKYLVDDALLGRDLRTLFFIVLLFVAITVSNFAVNVWSGLQYTRVSAEILFDMRLALYRHLQRLSPRFYAQTPLGDIVSRINNDIGEVQRIAAETVLASVGNVLFLSGTIFMLLWLDMRLFLLSMALLPVSLWALVHYRRQLADRVTALRESSAEIGSFLIETLQGMKLVVTSNAQQREVGRFRDKNDNFIRALMSMQFHTYLAGGLPGLILSASAAIVFLYGGYRVVMGTLTVGTFVAFTAYQMRLFSPIQALMGLYANLASARVSLQRIHQILDTKPEVVEQADAESLTEVRGEVSFEDVMLSFDRGEPVLKGVSFGARPGETVAVVGPSGSGKSTIADLLLRLFDPDSGVVRLDGRDLRTLCLDDLRRQVVLVDQQPFMFNSSIAENVRYARPEASDDDVERAARRAGIEEFIQGLPQKYETPVGERGMALSAGERQRIAIARAFLADPVVLVLDEATSALDSAAEGRIISGYEAIMKGRTTILISHRLELVSKADKVVVLEGTKVVEEGTLQELREGQGAFAQLFGASGS